MAEVRSAFASRELVVRRATHRPVACARTMAKGAGSRAKTVRPGSNTSKATTKEREKSTVSQVSMVNSRTPTPSTSTSPTILAMRSPIDVRCRSAIGQARTPRKASARTFARILALAVISHQRFPMRGTSVSNVPPTKASAAQPTSAAVASPRARDSARSIARPSRIAGRTTAVFMMMPATDPSTSWPATCRKYRRISQRKPNVRQPYGTKVYRTATAARVNGSSSSQRGVLEEPGNARDDHVAGTLEVLADRRHVPALDPWRPCRQLAEVAGEGDDDRRSLDIGRRET